MNITPISVQTSFKSNKAAKNQPPASLRARTECGGKQSSQTQPMVTTPKNMFIGLLMASGVLCGTTSCDPNPAEPNGKVYVVDRNSPETNPAQKTMNNMLDILGVFPAELRKSGVDTVRQSGIITNASYHDTQSNETHNMIKN